MNPEIPLSIIIVVLTGLTLLVLALGCTWAPFILAGILLGIGLHYDGRRLRR